MPPGDPGVDLKRDMRQRGPTKTGRKLWPNGGAKGFHPGLWHQPVATRALKLGRSIAPGCTHLATAGGEWMTHKSTSL